jgi:hypothetical protein
MHTSLLKLVNEIILYYDARSKKHQKSIHTYTNYQRPILDVTERSTNFLTIISIDLMLRRYENKTTASMKNPQIQLNINSFLIFLPTPHSMIILYIITSNKLNFSTVIQWNQFYFKFVYMLYENS